jgi:uncharacterized Fe-S cluster protein YjdI
MRDKVTKKYTNGEITVVWKPAACIHSGVCWKGLNAVFNPKVRPWVDINAASTEQISAQVDECPSGALSYFRNSDGEAATKSPSQVVVEVTQDGPLLITGDVTIKLSDGTEEAVHEETALCRCGQSGNKPFCDGSHTRTGFKG